MQLNSNKTTMENDTMIQEIAFTIKKKRVQYIMPEIWQFINP